MIYSFWLPFWYLQTFLASSSPERCHPIYFLLLKILFLESCQQIYIKATTLTGNFLKAYSSKLNIYFRNCAKVTKVTGIIDSTSSCSHSKPHDHQTFENEIHTRTLKLANQNAVFVGYDVLIGCFAGRSTKLVLKTFIAWSIPIFYKLADESLFREQFTLNNHKGFLLINIYIYKVS